MNCVICNQPFTDKKDEGVCQFAAFGGLPSPCCGHCFEANNFMIKSHTELAVKSLLRRMSKEESESSAKEKQS